MAQTIIAYTIIAVAAGYTIYSVVKKFKNKDKKSCGDCCGCKSKNTCCK